MALALLAVPGLAQADTVTIRIESTSGPLAPMSTVTLPTTAVAPVASGDQTQTCPGNSVVGAIHAATGGNWSGTWSDTTGWSVDKIKGIDASAPTGHRWAIIVDSRYLNDPPCHTTLTPGDNVLIFPMCGTSTTSCYSKGILVMYSYALPAVVNLDSTYRIQAYQIDTTFNSGTGTGAATASPSVGALFSWPGASALSTDLPTDPIVGTAVLAFHQQGDNPISLTKFGYAPDRADTCVTNGSDGYCGTSLPNPVPFDPNAFCTHNGNDGYCGTLDQVPPVGHVNNPQPGRVFSKTAHPAKIAGSVDFDPSMIDHVDIRLMRQLSATVKKVVGKRKVWVTKKVRGKKVRKRVTKPKIRKVKTNVCYGWNVSTSDWKKLKKCDASLAGSFRADGADTWSYEFLEPLPSGSYTLDALAQDGAGNTDSTMELGRNRVTFTVL